jgi:hypothetical protein
MRLVNSFNHYPERQNGNERYMQETEKLRSGVSDLQWTGVPLLFLVFLSGVCASNFQEFFRLAIQAGIEADSFAPR